jgi:hypothetical protein
MGEGSQAHAGRIATTGGPEAWAAYKQGLAIFRALSDRVDEGTALDYIEVVY